MDISRCSQEDIVWRVPHYSTLVSATATTTATVQSAGLPRSVDPFGYCTGSGEVGFGQETHSWDTLWCVTLGQVCYTGQVWYTRQVCYTCARVLHHTGVLHWGRHITLDRCMTLEWVYYTWSGVLQQTAVLHFDRCFTHTKCVTLG